MSQPTPDRWVTADIALKGGEGLHARPAIKLSRMARKFASMVQMRVTGEESWVDAKSVARLMGLRADAGKVVQLRASGADAEAAVAEIGRFFEHDLGTVGEGRE